MRPARGTAGYGLAIALLIHGGLITGLFAAPSPKREPPRRPPVKVRVVAPSRPPPPPAVVAAPEPPEAAKPVPKPKPEPRKAASEKDLVAKSASPEVTLPVPTPQPPAASPVTDPAPAKAPRKFTVAMDATIPSGGVAVPTAPAGAAWVFGAPGGSPDGAPVLPRPSGSDPKAQVSGISRGPAETAVLTKTPKLVSQPSEQEMRALYPEAARKDGLEADVSLRILVSSSGEVIDVRVVRPAGNGFDQAAEQLVRRFKFSPGERQGQAVSAWIPWVYRFRLDG
jgi:protein TonB